MAFQTLRIKSSLHQGMKCSGEQGTALLPHPSLPILPSWVTASTTGLAPDQVSNSARFPLKHLPVPEILLLVLQELFMCLLSVLQEQKLQGA